jgi:hypothetical protein
MLTSGTGGAPDNLGQFIHLKSAEPVKEPQCSARYL